MQTSFANGAAKVVARTTTDSSQRPLRPSPSGPENRLALSVIPAVLTVISDSRQAMANSEAQAKYSAIARFSVSVRARRSRLLHRTQRADWPGSRAGNVSNWPQY